MTHKLILASSSPRRIDLLKTQGITPAAVIPADIDETPLKAELPKNMVLRLSLAKAKTIAANNPDCFILAADTTVSVGRRILNKANDEAEARTFLELLSGRSQRVWGGIALITPTGKTISRAICTSVKFKTLTKSEIDTYVASHDWVGKAGGYGIQGAAAAFVKCINGSYTNIIGLSMYDTMNILNAHGYKTHASKNTPP
jgi:septum formation protein